MVPILESSAEARLGALRRELVLDLFLRSGSFWEAVVVTSQPVPQLIPSVATPVAAALARRVSPTASELRARSRRT